MHRRHGDSVADVRMRPHGCLSANERANIERNFTVVYPFVAPRRRKSINEPKLRAFDGDNLDRSVRDPSPALKISISGNPNDLAETYHFLAFATDPTIITGGVSNDRSFVANRIGRVFHLHMQKGDQQIEAVSNGSLHVGFALLAYQQRTDRVVPWEINPGAANCFSLSATDCLDLKTITRTLFVRIASGVSTAVTANVPGGSVARHQLHYFPQTKHAGIDPTRRARGFGFIYHARIEVPGGGFEVFVPLSFILLDNITNYTLIVDPISTFGLLGSPENFNRVFVRGDGLVGLGEGFVRDQIVTALQAITLPQLQSGVAFEDVAMLGLNIATGGSSPHLQGQPARLSPKYEAILVPDEERADHVFSSNVLWEIVPPGGPQEGRHVKLIFLE